MQLVVQSINLFFSVLYIVECYIVLTTGIVYELISGNDMQLLGPKRSPIDRVIRIEILCRPITKNVYVRNMNS